MPTSPKHIRPHPSRAATSPGRSSTRCSRRRASRAAHYRVLAEQLADAERRGVRGSAGTRSTSSFLNQGIGFTVYGEEEGLERIFPFDLIPRVIPRAEWDAHRARADPARAARSTCSSHDVYHGQRILRDGQDPGRARVRRAPLPARDDRRRPARRRLRARRRRRHRARRARRVPRARGQPALALGRELHAREPRRDEARVRAAVRALRRARHRPVPAGAARRAARGRAARGRRRRPSCC